MCGPGSHQTLQCPPCARGNPMCESAAYWPPTRCPQGSGPLEHWPEWAMGSPRERGETCAFMSAAQWGRRPVDRPEGMRWRLRGTGQRMSRIRSEGAKIMVGDTQSRLGARLSAGSKDGSQRWRLSKRRPQSARVHREFHLLPLRPQLWGARELQVPRVFEGVSRILFMCPPGRGGRCFVMPLPGREVLAWMSQPGLGW
jgi:hypothetical protein